MPSEDNQIHIINKGKEWDIEELRKRTDKARTMIKKNTNRQISSQIY
jgi:hypothetical protein